MKNVFTLNPAKSPIMDIFKVAKNKQKDKDYCSRFFLSDKPQYENNYRIKSINGTTGKIIIKIKKAENSLMKINYLFGNLRTGECFVISKVKNSIDFVTVTILKKDRAYNIKNILDSAPISIMKVNDILSLIGYK